MRQWEGGPVEPPVSPVLHAILSHGTAKRAITFIYAALQSVDTPSLAELRARWDADLVSPLTDTQWSQALCHIKKVSRNVRLRYTQLNYLHRTYLTPCRIAKMYTGTVAACPRCKHHRADFMHMVWSCPIISTAWQTVVDTLTVVVETPIPLTPEACLLGIRTTNKQNKCRNKLLGLACALFKRMIAMHWKSQTAPKVEAWLKILLKWAQAESDFMSDTQIHKEINVDNTHTWDTYMSIMLAKSDEKPP